MLKRGESCFVSKPKLICSANAKSKVEPSKNSYWGMCAKNHPRTKMGLVKDAQPRQRSRLTLLKRETKHAPQFNKLYNWSVWQTRHRCTNSLFWAKIRCISLILILTSIEKKMNITFSPSRENLYALADI